MHACVQDTTNAYGKKTVNVRALMLLLFSVSIAVTYILLKSQNVISTTMFVCVYVRSCAPVNHDIVEYSGQKRTKLIPLALRYCIYLLCNIRLLRANKQNGVDDDAKPKVFMIFVFLQDNIQFSDPMNFHFNKCKRDSRSSFIM